MDVAPAGSGQGNPTHCFNPPAPAGRGRENRTRSSPRPAGAGKKDQINRHPINRGRERSRVRRPHPRHLPENAERSHPRPPRRPRATRSRGRRRVHPTWDVGTRPCYQAPAREPHPRTPPTVPADRGKRRPTSRAPPHHRHPKSRQRRQPPDRGTQPSACTKPRMWHSPDQARRESAHSAISGTYPPRCRSDPEGPATPWRPTSPCDLRGGTCPSTTPFLVRSNLAPSGRDQDHPRYYFDPDVAIWLCQNTPEPRAQRARATEPPSVQGRARRAREPDANRRPPTDGRATGTLSSSSTPQNQTPGATRPRHDSAIEVHCSSHPKNSLVTMHCTCNAMTPYGAQYDLTGPCIGLLSRGGRCSVSCT